MRLIYLSPVPWGSYAQRPHFMVRYFLERGGAEVLWVNPYPSRLPKFSDLRRSPRLHCQGTKLESRISVLSPRIPPVEPIPGAFHVSYAFSGRQLDAAIQAFCNRGKFIFGLGKPSVLGLTLLSRLRPQWSFFDIMDDFPLFHRGLSRFSIARLERRIRHRVDVVFASSHNLADKYESGSATVKCITNACDPAVLPEGPDFKDDSAPIFGYIGSLGEWFDWGAVRAIAEAVPQGQVHLIGPCLAPPPARLPSNIHLLPPCRHDEIGAYLKGFTVGLIPFLKNDLTRGVDPIKYYDYRASGLPVLSTTFGEMEYHSKQEGVFFLDGPGGVHHAAKAAMGFRQNRENLMAWRNENSWWTRFSRAGLFEEWRPSR